MIELLELGRAECLRLLAANSGRVGRIALSPPGSSPLIRPVNYVFDEESASVAFRSGLGSKFDAVLSSGTAAFEIDGGDPVERTGWSVIVVGVTEEIVGRAQLARFEALELEPWAPGAKGHWLGVRGTSVSGRRIVRSPGAVPGDGA